MCFGKNMAINYDVPRWEMLPFLYESIVYCITALPFPLLPKNDSIVTVSVTAITQIYSVIDNSDEYSMVCTIAFDKVHKINNFIFVLSKYQKTLS